MRIFRDERYEDYITEEELKEEFENGNNEAETFEDYIRNCTSKDGTLEEVNAVCENCINEIMSRGENIWIGKEIMDYDECEERNCKCCFCDNIDTLLDCVW